MAREISKTKRILWMTLVRKLVFFLNPTLANYATFMPFLSILPSVFGPLINAMRHRALYIFRTSTPDFFKKMYILLIFVVSNSSNNNNELAPSNSIGHEYSKIKQSLKKHVYKA